MGPDKTRFDAGTLELGQFVANVDVSRAFRIGGLAGPLNVAMGAEFRHENYVIHAGEPDSYGDGGVPNQFGGRAAIGAQVFPGFRPSNEVDESRHSVAGYVDVEGDLVDWLRVGVAARAEDYSDFGGTLDGKLTLRVQPDRRFVLRGSVSTGFRAPSLGQSFFSSTATNFLNLGQGLVPVESLTLPVTSAPAKVLGAEPLKPESSLNVGAGVVITPISRAVDCRRLLPHRHRRSHRPLRQLHGAADRRPAGAVRREQRAVLHQRDRYPDQRCRRHSQLPARPRVGWRSSAPRRLQQHADRSRRGSGDPAAAA